MQEVIRKYTKISPSGNKYAALASALGSLTWEKPLYSDYQQLSRYCSEIFAFRAMCFCLVDNE